MFASAIQRLNDRPETLAGDAGDDAGFTLIELMVVLLILAILLAIAIPTFLGVTKSANDRAAQSNLNTALVNAKAYYQNQSQTYTTTAAAVAALSSRRARPDLPGRQLDQPEPDPRVRARLTPTALRHPGRRVQERPATAGIAVDNTGGRLHGRLRTRTCTATPPAASGPGTFYGVQKHLRVNCIDVAPRAPASAEIKTHFQGNVIPVPRCTCSQLRTVTAFRLLEHLMAVR